MFASELVVAVAAYLRGNMDLEALEEAASTRLLDDVGTVGSSMADDVLLAIAEFDRGDISRSELSRRLESLAPAWVPTWTRETASSDTTLHEPDAIIAVPAWVATAPEVACA